MRRVVLVLVLIVLVLAAIRSSSYPTTGAQRRGHGLAAVPAGSGPRAMPRRIGPQRQHAPAPGPRELFVDEPGPSPAPARPPGVLRARTVRLDLGRLDDAGEAVLGFFEDAAFHVRLRRMPRGFDELSCDAWEGSVEGAPGSEVLLLARGGSVVGEARIPGRGVFQVRPLQEGGHIVTEVDRASTPSGCHALEGGRPPDAAGGEVGGASESIGDPGASPRNVVIDLLVAYTRSAADSVGGLGDPVLLAVQAAIRQGNAVLRRSGISAEFRLVHLAPVSYVESGSSDRDLVRLRDPRDGHMDGLHALRDQHAADLVCLWVGSMDERLGGLAYVLSSASPIGQESGFSLVLARCATTDFVFSHELGHNLGCAHDRDHVDARPVFPFAYGHSDGDRRTIMAYAPPDYVVGYFSSPSLRYQGRPLGRPGLEDNARAIRTTAPIVAEFRRSRGPRADAGADVIASDVDGNGRETVWLHGRRSAAGPGRRIVAYEWRDARGTVLSRLGLAAITLALGRHDLVLVVTDDLGATAGDEVTVWVVREQCPKADAGPDLMVPFVDGGRGTDVVLDGSRTLDPDGVILAYIWEEEGREIARGRVAEVWLDSGGHDIDMRLEIDFAGPTDPALPCKLVDHLHVEVTDRVLLVPREYGTIQAALDAAVNGDVVLVADGTYRGPGNRDLTFRGKAVVLRSEHGSAATRIDCEGSPFDPHRGFDFVDRETAQTVVEGFTIVRGLASQAAPNAADGGAIRCAWASPTLRDLVLSGNVAQRNGGGIYVADGAPRLERCRLDGNRAAGSGGGVYMETRTPPSSTFGALTRQTWIQDTVFFANRADVQGGGIGSRGVPLFVVNATLASNVAPRGPGIAHVAAGAPLFVTNTILWANRLPVGTPSQIWVSPAVGSSLLAYCDIQGGASGPGNINLDPRFQGLSTGDLRLVRDPSRSFVSPCIDAANGDVASVSDRDGNRRVDAPGVVNTGTGVPDFVDMGAHEWVLGRNVSPVARAGASRWLPAGSIAVLDGSASFDTDLGPLPLRFRWSGPGDVSITRRSSARASFTVPFDFGRELAFRLFVSDGQDSAEDVTRIGVTVLRGDADLNGRLDLSDANAILRFLSQGGSLRFLEAGDADANGRINLTDAIYLLNHLFRGGPAPSPVTGPPTPLVQ